MDRSKHKSGKKEKNKVVDKYPLFVSDPKNMKENMKIKEILRTVKMNSSMRIKAPQGSKVMNNRDFNDNEDYFEEGIGNYSQQNTRTEESPSATNTNVITPLINIDVETEDNGISQSTCAEASRYIHRDNSEKDGPELNTDIENAISSYGEPDISAVPKSPDEVAHIKHRDRKLSLDQTMLSRREGLSQSEMDLHSFGKSPLERKSSFFRKKMDSFLRNTTEIFRRQSQTSKTQPPQRRGSKSLSLQSLNEQCTTSNGEYGETLLHNQQELRDSVTSLSTLARSSSIASSMSLSPGEPLEQYSPAGSQPMLFASQPLEDCASDSVPSLNEGYLQQSLLKSRAISMSSGLDAPQGRLRRKASKSNRVTWLASEGLTNYFKRVIQDEKVSQIETSHSYHDFSIIPEDRLYGPKTDSKGRRLSYQRAVSGEDPVLPARYNDSTQKRRNYIPEHHEANYELSKKLEDFTNNGVPTLKGFLKYSMRDEAFAYFVWCEREENLFAYLDESVKLTDKQKERQAAITELILTEIAYVKHLTSLVELFIAAAHCLQDEGFMLDVKTERLFSNVPDLLNANLLFWEKAFYPMLLDAVSNCAPLNPEMMSGAYVEICEILFPYELYVLGQPMAIDYLRTLQSSNPDFMQYLNWCQKQKECNRLQLSDILVKPMQRLTKYPLLLSRISSYTEPGPELKALDDMEMSVKNFVQRINRSARRRDEIERLDILCTKIEPFEIDFKDEDMDKCFKMFAKLNLKKPMKNCLPDQKRSVIHEGDLRYRDNVKETEVRVFLLTDMMLVCKRTTKGGSFSFKMIRPKYMVDKIKALPKYGRGQDLVGLVIVTLDEFNSAQHCFTLSESAKEDKSQSTKQGTLQLWEIKIKEAKKTYELGVWYAKNSSTEILEFEHYPLSDQPGGSGSGQTASKGAEDAAIERDARERIAVMMQKSMVFSTDNDFSQFSTTTESLEGRIPRQSRSRYSRSSTGESSRGSRFSSFQQSKSSSHDDQTSSSRIPYRASSSAEHTTASPSFDEVTPLIPPEEVTATSPAPIPIPTVIPPSPAPGTSKMSFEALSPFPESGPDQISEQRSPMSAPVPVPIPVPVPAAIAAQLPTPIRATIPPPSPGALPVPIPVPVPIPIPFSSRSWHTPRSRSAQSAYRPSRAGSVSPSTLAVQPEDSKYFVHSLPDLTFEPDSPNKSPSSSCESASERLYRMHYENLLEKRMSTLQQQQSQLCPGSRGRSYPPPSPTRGSLKRSLAFSYSLKNPPLSKMGHVHSQMSQELLPTGHHSAIQSSATSPGDASPERRPKSACGRRQNARANFSHTTPTDDDGNQVNQGNRDAPLPQGNDRRQESPHPRNAEDDRHPPKKHKSLSLGTLKSRDKRNQRSRSAGRQEGLLDVGSPPKRSQSAHGYPIARSDQSPTHDQREQNAQRDPRVFLDPNALREPIDIPDQTETRDYGGDQVAPSDRFEANDQFDSGSTNSSCSLVEEVTATIKMISDNLKLHASYERRGLLMPNIQFYDNEIAGDVQMGQDGPTITADQVEPDAADEQEQPGTENNQGDEIDQGLQVIQGDPTGSGAQQDSGEPSDANDPSSSSDSSDTKGVSKRDKAKKSEKGKKSDKAKKTDKGKKSDKDKKSAKDKKSDKDKKDADDSKAKKTQEKKRSEDEEY